MATAPSAPAFERLAGIRALAESGCFKVWFLDQFGVLHEGKKTYPGAILALEKLAGNGAKMVIISNSSRRSSLTMEKLKSLGFDTSCFLAAITSGELTHQYLRKALVCWLCAMLMRPSLYWPMVLKPWVYLLVIHFPSLEELERVLMLGLKTKLPTLKLIRIMSLLKLEICVLCLALWQQNMRLLEVAWAGAEWCYATECQQIELAPGQSRLSCHQSTPATTEEASQGRRQTRIVGFLWPVDKF